MDGGIFGLLGLIRDHRGAVEYDWRTRFGLSLAVIGDGMSLAEASRLAVILRSDPSSMIAAAIEGWDFPINRETAAILDLYDLQYAKTGTKNRKPHPGRPYKTDDGTETRKRGDVAGRTRDEVVAILARFGHAAPPV